MMAAEETNDGMPIAHQVAVRIAPPDPADLSESTAQMLESLKGLNGDRVLNVFGVLAHHPRALRHGMALGGAFMFGSNIGDRHREIVIIRIARNTRCEYEYAQHYVLAQNWGMTADECVEVVGRSVVGDAFTDFERAIIAGVDELCDDDLVSDATWAQLAAEWDDRQLIEYVMLAGYYRMLAGYLNSAGVQIDEGLSGFPTA